MERLLLSAAAGLLLGGPLPLPRHPSPVAHRSCSNPLLQASEPTSAVKAPAAAAPYKPTVLADESQLAIGQIVECVIIGKLEPSKGKKYARGYVVDIGASKPAFVPRNHVALRANASTGSGINSGQGWAELPEGTVFEAQIIGIQDKQVNVSLARVQKKVAWQRVSQLADMDLAVKGTVIRLGEAGASLDIEGLPAFCPWSHWNLPVAKRTNALLGTKLPIKFLEADRVKRRLVVSNRRVRLEGASSELEPGSVVEGQVKAIKDYGAVVTLDSGIEGLLHVSQISQVFVKDIADCFDIGDAVRCVVIKVGAEDGSISLSTKMLEEKPGEMLRNASAVYLRSVAASEEGSTASEEGSTAS